MKPRIVVLASGSGSNFQSIINSINAKIIDASIVRLIASRDGIGAIDKAIKAGIPFAVINKKTFDSTEHFESVLLRELTDAQPDLIVLAGYLVQVPVPIIRAFEGKIINIHPSLLPAYGGKGYYGLKVHSAVIQDKQKESGCTVHMVTEEYDEGPILAQSKVPVLDEDTPESLAARVLAKEHEILPITIKHLLNQ